MTTEQEEEFKRLIELGRVRVDVMDGLRALIERVEDEPWERGKTAGASPHDGSWPASQ
jgi:hypothetical protein